MNEGQDQADFLKYFLKVQPGLRGYLLAAVRDPVEMDDMMQEVSLVLWQKFAQFDRKRHFTAWAFGIARLQILKRRQSQARSKLVFSEEAVAALAATAGEEAEFKDERLAQLSACLEKLPPRDKKVMTLKLGESRSMAEIGVRIGKSEAAVQMMMMRIRRWLRTCVGKSMAMKQARVS